MKAAPLIVTILFLAVAGSPAAARSSPLPAGAYRTQANAICAREQRESIARLTGSKDLAHYLAAEEPVLRMAVTSLERLSPPSSLAVPHSDVVNVVKGQLALITSLAARAKAGKLTSAQWQNNATLRNLNTRELALWMQLGAEGCANP